MTLTKASFSMITGAPVNVMDFGAVGDGIANDLPALQEAHDSLPASGGTIYLPRGNYCLTQDNSYLVISKSNVTVLGDAGAIISSPGSADPEITTGNRYLSGIRVTGNDCVVSVNMRGPSILWVPDNATDVFTVRDMRLYNPYVGGIYIQGDKAFDVLTVENVTFENARDLASDPGNYEAIQRSSASTDPMGNLVVVSNCIFRSMAGGVDVHNVRDVMICNGTSFQGCDILAIKLSMLSGYNPQNLTVDETVVIDGAAVNPLSANRHIACTGLGRTSANFALYAAFIQVFDNVQFHGKIRNFANNVGLAFLDGSYIDAVLNLDRSTYENCTTAILDVQGTVSMCDMQLTSANIVATNVSTVRSLTFAKNRMVNSYAQFTKRCVQVGSKYNITNNVINYNVNNLGAVRISNLLVDNAPTVLFDQNEASITGGGNTLVATDGGTGTRMLVGADNKLSAGNTITGQYLTNYEYKTVGPYTGSLDFPLYSGQMTLVNTNCTGFMQYVIQDAVSPNMPVGTIIKAVRTHPVNQLQFACVGGSMSGYTSASLDSQYASIVLEKIGANSWVIISTLGTVTLL